MARKEHVHSLVVSAIHLRDCQIRPTEKCQECMKSLIVISNALAEALDVGEAIRKLLATAKMPTGVPGV